jgi:hypothetical protein
MQQFNLGGLRMKVLGYINKEVHLGRTVSGTLYPGTVFQPGLSWVKKEFHDKMLLTMTDLRMVYDAI